jgi:hypothetical protein
MSRWKAAGIHIALSATIATLVVLVMYGLWYPPPYFGLMGGPMLIVLIAGCDVVLGPLITLIIFKSGKRGLKFDLVVIALAQLSALCYGLYTMYEARPVFTVFAVDRFDVVTPSDFKPGSLDHPSAPEYGSLPLTGPVVVGARLPTDPVEKEKLLFGKLGGDITTLPRFYVPYDSIAPDVARKAKPLTALEAKNPQERARIENALGNKIALDKAGYVPIMGTFTEMAVIVDTGTGRIVTIVDANPW